ncbi:MAG TPA: cytochrome P450 [Candidatus Acidoferrales bacterium]
MIKKGPRDAQGNLPPGPRGNVLLGSAIDLGRSSMKFLTQCAREYGDIVYLRFFNTPICLLTHPNDIEYVLVKNQANFVKSRDYRALKSVLGNGLLTNEGASWQKQRKLVQPAFRHENTERYADVMVLATTKMLDTWEDGETRDLHQQMMAVTLDIVAEALFGSDVSGHSSGVEQALAVLMNQFEGMAGLAFLLPEKFPLPSTLKFKKCVAQLDKIIYSIIHERRKARRPAHDLLEMLLLSQDSEGSTMSDEQLRDEVMTLFLAGHETTANALSWTWYLLAQHPEVEARLFAELSGVLQGRLPTARDVGKLCYTEMVVKEAMRLYPPAWAVGRQAVAKFELGGYSFPAGTNIAILQWSTQRDARFFPEPEVFDPSRWSAEGMRKNPLPRFAYFPFGGGPRVCVGAGFAMMEAILLLATMAQRFGMSLVAGRKVKLLPSVTLRPKNGIRMILHERRREAPVRGAAD